MAHWIPADVLDDPAVRDALADVPFRAHNAKALLRGLDLDMRGLQLDTAIAAYLIDPAGTQYLLDDLAARFLGLEIRSPDAPPPGQLDLSGTAKDPAEEAGRRAVAVGLVAPALEQSLDQRGLRRLHDEVERPLVRVLARMEKSGVRVDVDFLRSIYDGLVTEGARLEEEIQELAGERFLVNSTLQLRRILFDKLGLQPQKKTKTGFSTDAASLEKLRGLHPIVEPLLRYREVEKLRSTYGESLLAEVAPDGRIHATFNQTVARTGRLSSDRPNLHNIPIRTEEGRRIRQAFLPAEGCRFLVADYNQIELRVIAHLAQDPGLIEAFATGQDIHRATAARLFAVDPDDVTLGMRSKAKMVSYGLAYGMESYGLGQRLGIPTEEAAQVLGAYFEAFPSVRSYMERTVAEARDRGYTETLFGRRRQIPELQSQNYRLRQAGERQAMNAGIQGLAADIFKVALVRLDLALDAHGPRQPPRPAGPRRGDPRGPTRRGGGRRRRHPRGHAGRGRAVGAAGGQPGLGRQLGHRKKLRQVPARIAIHRPVRPRTLPGGRAGRAGSAGRRWLARPLHPRPAGQPATGRPATSPSRLAAARRRNRVRPLGFGHGDGPPQARLGVGRVLRAEGGEGLAPETVQLGLADPLAALGAGGKSLRRRRRPPPPVGPTRSRASARSARLSGRHIVIPAASQARSRRLQPPRRSRPRGTPSRRPTRRAPR